MSLEKFFQPKSVAVVGASRGKGKVGYEIVANMVAAGYEGKLYPVNPKADEICGVKCHGSLKAIGETPDLVVIVVPAKVVPAVMQECADLRVEAVVVITAGFKETGSQGKELEQTITQIARRNGIRMVGPNCLGLMSPKSKLNASFAAVSPLPGNVGYLSQSGALVTAILDVARAGNLGFSKMISIGNKADLDELDLIKAMGDDDDTKVIAGYLENIAHGDEFVREAEAISRHKPILLMKSGGTGAGAAAASSHTGSLAGSEVAYECVFERAGIIRCESIEAQFDYMQAFVSQPLPQGPNVVVVTNAGGPGIMAADAIEHAGLTFAKLADETIEKLAGVMPSAANIHNPIDVLGDAQADRYEFAIGAAAADPSVHAIIVLLTPQAMTQARPTAEAIVRTAGKCAHKPVLACFMGQAQVAEGVAVLRAAQIPQYNSPERAVDALVKMVKYAHWRSRPKRIVKLFPVNRRKVERIIDRHLRRQEREIGEVEAKEILEAYGFATPKGEIATSAEQAAGIAEQLRYPVVMKIWSPDILHKSDVGGVKVGLGSAQEVMDAFDLMMYRIPKKRPDASIIGVLVQEMCRKGQEVILGMHRDPHFGPMVMFGMGGILVEVLKDVTFYLAPLTAEESREMLVRTRTYQMLKGVRGQEGVDIDAIADGLQRISQLVTEFPQIVEMDINPFVVGRQGTTPIAVDARISVEEVK